MDLLTLLIGGGLLAFVQWLVDKIGDLLGKKSKTVKAIEELSKQVNDLKKTMDEREAVLARTHILRFADEIYNGVYHSQEYFLQTLDDIKQYREFCRKNPEFENERTVMAANNIKTTYNNLCIEGAFTGRKEDHVHDKEE